MHITRCLLAVALLGVQLSAAAAQTRKPAAKPAPPPPVALKKVAPDMTCPSPLGIGGTAKRACCDVMAEQTPAAGVLITLPPHAGPVTLTFDLHNRHTYSEEQVKSN